MFKNLVEFKQAVTHINRYKELPWYAGMHPLCYIKSKSHLNKLLYLFKNEDIDLSKLYNIKPSHWDRLYGNLLIKIKHIDRHYFMSPNDDRYYSYQRYCKEIESEIKDIPELNVREALWDYYRQGHFAPLKEFFEATAIKYTLNKYMEVFEMFEEWSNADIATYYDCCVYLKSYLDKKENLFLSDGRLKIIGSKSTPIEKYRQLAKDTQDDMYYGYNHGYEFQAGIDGLEEDLQECLAQPKLWFNVVNLPNGLYTVNLEHGRKLLQLAQ